MNPRVKEVVANNDYTLTLTFDNEEVKMFDMRRYLEIPVFEELKDIERFKTARVFCGTVVWKNEQDLCPDIFYLESVLY